MADQKAEVRLTANAAGLQASMGAAAAAVEQNGQRMRAALDEVGSQFLSVRTLLAGAFAAVNGALAAVVRGAINFQDEASKAALKAGVTTEQFTGMAYAAKLADVSTEELARAYARLSGTLSDAKDGQKEAVELFRRMKLDPAGIKDADALLLALAERFADMRDGAARTAFAIDVFGERIGPKLVPFLAQGREGIADLRAEAEQLGLVVSTETGKAAEEFNDTLTRLQSRVQGLQVNLATALLPTLQRVATTFQDVGRDGLIAEAVGRGVRVAFEALAVVGANVSFVFGGIGRELGAVAAQLSLVYEVLRAPPGEIIATAKRNWSQWSVISEAVKADGARARAELDAFEKRILGIDSGAGAGRGFINPPSITPPAGGPGWSPLPKVESGGGGGGGDGEKSQMTAFEAQLDAERLAAAQRDALRGMSKAAEAAYWQNILATATLSEADKVAVSRKAAQARVQVLQQEAREADQIGQTNLAAWQQRALAAVDLDADTARYRVAMGESTQAELLAQEQQFEQRRYEIKLTALQASAAAIDPTRDPVQVAQVNAQIEALEQAHQLRLQQIRGQVAVESANQLNAIWTDLGGRMSSLWDQGVNAMMNGTLTWKNALKAAGAELGGWFGGIVKQQVKTWLFGEQAKTGATAAGTAQRWLMESWAAAKSVALWAATAVKNIMVSAWEAMAAAWKAVAGIPVIGPVLAPVMAGVAFAGVAAIAGKVASAEGGYDIPAGLNPMTQLHEREMVLPARHADVIRELADNGGGGGSGPINITIHALDGADVRRVLLNNSHHVADSVKQAVRMFQLTPEGLKGRR